MSGDSWIVPGDGTYVLGWTDSGQNTSIVFVVDENGNLVRTTTFSGSTIGLAASQSAPNLIRRIGGDAVINESRNLGVSWQLIGAVPTAVGGIDSVAFDPNNIARIAVGVDGAAVTANSGNSWTTATFDSNPTANIVVFSIVFSSDGNTIWAHGRNLDEFFAGNPNDGRHLWQSVDGGLNFASVAEQGPGVVLTNFLIAHPSNPNLVYWSGGKFGDPTTHLYQYSKATGVVTRVELSDGSPFFDVFRFAFHPTNPNYMYFGLFWP